MEDQFSLGEFIYTYVAMKNIYYENNEANCQNSAKENADNQGNTGTDIHIFVPYVILFGCLFSGVFSLGFLEPTFKTDMELNYCLSLHQG